MFRLCLGFRSFSNGRLMRLVGPLRLLCMVLYRQRKIRLNRFLLVVLPFGFVFAFIERLFALFKLFVLFKLEFLFRLVLIRPISIDAASANSH